VSSRSEEIHRRLLHIEMQGAKPLNSVQKEVYPTLTAKFSHTLRVEPEAAEKLHRTQGNEPGVVVDRGEGNASRNAAKDMSIDIQPPLPTPLSPSGLAVWLWPRHRVRRCAGL
jgi:hypothetical protein